MARGIREAIAAPRRALERLLVHVPGDPERLREACGAVRDWEWLHRAATRHGVAPVLFGSLAELRVPMPEEIAGRVKRELGGQMIWQSHLREAFDEVLEALRRASVPACPLKGPILAERIYPEAEWRMTTDIDVLVAPERVGDALDALDALGYEYEGPAVVGPDTFELRLRRSDEMLVELHFKARVGFGSELAAADLLERAAPYRTAGGAACLVLAPEDELLLLAAHAGGHAFDRLAMLFDLKLLIERTPELDWERVIWRADRYGYGRVLRHACALLRDAFGTAVPVAERGAIQWCAALLHDMLERVPKAQPLPGVVRAARVALMFESRRAGAGYLGARIADWTGRRLWSLQWKNSSW